MARYSGAIVDVDGTLVRGPTLLPGAADGLRALRDAGIGTLLFSNNPTKSAAYYRDRLRDYGLPLDDAQVLTAAVVTAEYLAAEHPSAALFVVGESGLREEFVARDLCIDPDPTNAAVVVASIDREFDYDLLGDSMVALDHAELFVGTDPDRTIPTETGRMPGSGAIIAALEGVSGREPDLVVGKPSPVAAGAALERLGVPPEECLVVGDRLDTDLAMGERFGMTTVLVLTGISDRADVADADLSPDYVIDSVEEIDRVLADR